MFHPSLRLVLAVFVGIAPLVHVAWADGPFALYDEPYRPGFHFTPAKNWTNEPNGLVRDADGIYHIFYQANPFNNQFGNQSWGHATSPDLVHWTHQPIAIPAADGIMSYSGSAVHDTANTSGLGTGGKGPLVAVYTGHNIFNGEQDQRLAYSNDGGVTWTKFADNPVLDIDSNEFRDPKVFWHAPTQKWKMIASHGGQKKVTFWESSNLKNWNFLSEFNGAGMPGNIGGWETPELFELAVDGNPANRKWVLSTTPANGSPAGGNGVMYFVGHFDGTRFTNDNDPSTVLWADHGRDFDGQQAWNNTTGAGGRHVWTAIMQSYGEHVPTTPWRGTMALPRELQLTQTSEGVRLVQKPAQELIQLRGEPMKFSNLLVAPRLDPLDAHDINSDMLEVIATFDAAGASATEFGLSVREGGSQFTKIGYNKSTGKMFVDRRSAGRSDFDPNVATFDQAPLSVDNGKVKLHAYIDRSTVELFGNDGLAVISDLIFPDSTSLGVSAFAQGGSARLLSLEVYPIKSIWTPGAPPPTGGNSLARWSMDPVPHFVGGHNPVTIDQQTLFGEGSRLGTHNIFYEPDPAADHLWRFNSLPNQPFVTSNAVPPEAMLANGNSAGLASYDAGAIRDADGALFFPATHYGDEFNFSSAFSLETFFKTDGNQSNGGWMQLLMQGEENFRFGLIVNEGGPGNVRFAINDARGQIPLVDIRSVTGRNYADGEWHYVLATYDPNAGTNGELSLTLTNPDGTFDTAKVAISSLFRGLPSEGDGNLLIGRNTYGLAEDPRTFLGLIDEVRISRSVLTNGRLLGRVRIGWQAPLYSGHWTMASNWAEGIVPNAVGAKAQFLGGISAPATILTNTNIVVGSLEFDNANRYTLAGVGSLALQSAQGPASIRVLQGHHKISLPLSFASDTQVNIDRDTTLVIDKNTTIQAGKTVTKNGDLAVNAPLAIERAGRLVLTSGVTQLLGAPSLAAGAKIDVKRGELTISYQDQANPAAIIESQLASGYNGGAWTGEGIQTTSAVLGYTGLGWMDDPASESILVRFTYAGDADLSGVIDGTDYALIDNGFNAGLAGWFNGDFDYNGVVDGTDYAIIDNGFNSQGAPLGLVAVPEPTSLATALLALAALLAMVLRRRIHPRAPLA